MTKRGLSELEIRHMSGNAFLWPGQGLMRAQTPSEHGRATTVSPGGPGQRGRSKRDRRQRPTGPGPRHGLVRQRAAAGKETCVCTQGWRVLQAMSNAIPGDPAHICEQAGSAAPTGARRCGGTRWSNVRRGAPGDGRSFCEGGYCEGVVSGGGRQAGACPTAATGQRW